MPLPQPRAQRRLCNYSRRLKTAARGVGGSQHAAGMHRAGRPQHARSASGRRTESSSARMSLPPMSMKCGVCGSTYG